MHFNPSFPLHSNLTLSFKSPDTTGKLKPHADSVIWLFKTDCSKEAEAKGVDVAEWQQSKTNILAALLQRDVLVEFYKARRDEKNKELEKLNETLDPIRKQLSHYDGLIAAIQQQSTLQMSSNE